MFNPIEGLDLVAKPGRAFLNKSEEKSQRFIFEFSVYNIDLENVAVQNGGCADGSKWIEHVWVQDAPNLIDYVIENNLRRGDLITFSAKSRRYWNKKQRKNSYCLCFPENIGRVIETPDWLRRRRKRF